VSLAVDSQFLSLYYKSKGFDGATLGVLFSLTPLTTFLTVPVWGMLTRAGGDEKNNDNGNGKSSIHEKATKRPFQILCMNIAIATICQISLAILDEPIHMMLVIIIAGLFQSPAKPMLDGIMMDHIEDRSNFGKFGFFSTLGSGFGTNLGGRLLTMSQKSIIVADNHIENIGTENFRDFISTLLSGFNLLFFARFILTIPPIICIRQLQIAATVKMRSGKNSTSNIVLKRTKKATDHQTPETDKEKSTSMISVSRDVAKHCFGNRLHLMFFLCIFVVGASGGVSDAFSCK
jgi:hypothetical protein